MKTVGSLTLASVTLLLAVFGCSTGRRTESQRQTSSQKSSGFEQTFSFTAQRGVTTEITCRDSPHSDQIRLCIFNPPIASTEGNLYAAMLETLWTVWGKHYGLPGPRDFVIRRSSMLKADYYAWRLPGSNSDARLCLAPAATDGKLNMMYVWIE